jgi:hypothetical protein
MQHDPEDTIIRQSSDGGAESSDFVACRRRAELHDTHPTVRNKHPTTHGIHMTPKRKLNEVALPLEASSKASARMRPSETRGPD